MILLIRRRPSPAAAVAAQTGESRAHGGGDGAEEGFEGGQAGADDAQVGFEVDPDGGWDNGIFDRGLEEDM